MLQHHLLDDRDLVASVNSLECYKLSFITADQVIVCDVATILGDISRHIETKFYLANDIFKYNLVEVIVPLKYC